MARRGSKKVTIWGYILQMPGRPTQEKQREVLAGLGVDLTRYGTVWTDRLDRAKRYAGAGQEQLTGRNDLIAAAQPGDRVIVADPMCLGVSPKDAQWFLERMAEADVSVTINGDLYQVEPGGDAGEVVAEFARRLRNFNTARSRGRV